MPHLEESLSGQVRPGFYLLDFSLFPLDLVEFGGGRRGHLGQFRLERSQFGLELADQFLFSRNGAQSFHGLVEAAGGQIETGDLKVGLRGQGGAGP